MSKNFEQEYKNMINEEIQIPDLWNRIEESIEGKLPQSNPEKKAKRRPIRFYTYAKMAAGLFILIMVPAIVIVNDSVKKGMGDGIPASETAMEETTMEAAASEDVALDESESFFEAAADEDATSGMAETSEVIWVSGVQVTIESVSDEESKVDYTALVDMDPTGTFAQGERINLVEEGQEATLEFLKSYILDLSEMENQEITSWKLEAVVEELKNN